MTLLTSINEYLTYLIAEKGDSPKTIEAYQIDLTAFLKLIGNKEIQEITSEDLLKYQQDLYQKGYQQTSIVRKSMVIKGLFSYLSKNNQYDFSFQEITLPKVDKKLPVYLTSKEVKLLLKQPDIHTKRGLLDYTMMLIAYSCGLRVSELVELRFDHIFQKGGYLKVLGKRSKERIIPLSEEVLFALNYYENHYRNFINTKSLFVFLHQNGNLVSRQYFFLRLKEYAKQADINKKISPHTLRHSFASALLQNGAKLNQVQVLLGHEDIKTTEIYTHLTHTKEKEEYEEAMHR